MKIYRLIPDTQYRLMYPVDEVYHSEYWEFNGHSLIDSLPLNFEAYYSDTDEASPTSDIAYLGMSTFAFRKDVADTLAEDILEPAGELLPFSVNGQLWYCLNVTKIAAPNVLDKSKSRYEIEEEGLQINLLSGFFDVGQLPDTSLFKMPHDNYSFIYCVDRRDNDSQVLGNFFTAVAAHKYTGLKFIEVYSS